MTISRRKTLSLLGGGVVLAAAGSAIGFVATRNPASALAPWDRAGTYEDVRMHALSYAILAPNPHNRQPWVAELVGEDEVRIFRDPQRNLPQTDPFDRQMTIGMGCFLELLRIAASARGFGVDLALFPQGDQGPVAVARFIANGAKPDALFDHILTRRSCKEPFTTTPVPEGLLDDYARIIRQPDQVEAVRAITWTAWMVEANTHRTMKESVDLMRFGRAEIEANPDGIDLGGPFLEGLMRLGMLTRESQLDPNSSSFQQGVAMYREMLAATPAYAVLTSPDNTRQSQVESGGKWVRLNLAATAAGLSLHPVSQALQEFPEMAEPYAQIHALLAPAGHTVQMLGRLGYGPQVARSPRWPLESRMRNA
jgi:hypothetical protein